MKIGRVENPSAKDRRILSILWPEALKMLAAEGGFPPLDDPDMVEHRGDLPAWIGDKFEILRRIMPGNVGLDACPFDRAVVSKPCRNPGGLATGAKLHRFGSGPVAPGDMWQTYWEGQHWSADIVVWEGMPRGCVVAQGLPSHEFGQFAAWRIWETPPRINIPLTENELDHLGMGNYCGVVNVEFIVPFDAPTWGCIVELHFRPSMCFGPVYGAQLRRALLRAHKGEEFDGALPQPGGGIAVPVPRKRPHATVTDRMLCQQTSWRAGVEFYG